MTISPGSKVLASDILGIQANAEDALELAAMAASVASGAVGTATSAQSSAAFAQAAADQALTAIAAITGLATSPSYDTDAAAASAGVGLHKLYRNGNFIMVRMT